MLRQEFLRQDRVLPTGAEGAREAVVVLEGAPCHSGLEALLGPSGVDLVVKHVARKLPECQETGHTTFFDARVPGKKREHLCYVQQ